MNQDGNQALEGINQSIYKLSGANLLSTLGCLALGWSLQSGAVPLPLKEAPLIGTIYYGIGIYGLLVLTFSFIVLINRSTEARGLIGKKKYAETRLARLVALPLWCTLIYVDKRHGNGNITETEHVVIAIASKSKFIDEPSALITAAKTNSIRHISPVEVTTLFNENRSLRVLLHEQQTYLVFGNYPTLLVALNNKMELAAQDHATPLASEVRSPLASKKNGRLHNR